jgi:dephospho-CoA kinase
MDHSLQLIGVAGTAGAGKDTATEIICKLFGLQNTSTGDMVRAITRQVYGLPPDFNPVRDQLYEVATYVRTEVHPAGMVKLCILQAKVQKGTGAVLSGLRSRGEADAIREAGGIIVGVDADPKVRYGRIYARQRDAETGKTYDQFLQQDEYENRGISETGPGRGIKSIIESADILITNNGSLEELTAQIKEKLGPLVLQ